MERIGIYGGTFNPPHAGHIQAAKQAVTALNLDKLVIVPTSIAPHKAIPEHSPTPRQRLEMLRIAAADCPKAEVSDIELNRGASLLVCGENSVRLSEKEFRILEYLIANAGQILTREQLAVKIWGYESDAEYNNVEVYMSFARKKLNFVKAKVEIKAVRGIGYELRYDHV